MDHYEAVRARNATTTCGIEDHLYEKREFEVADPDGNRLIFGEHLSPFEDTQGEGQ